MPGECVCARVEGACWCLVSECVEMIARCVCWEGRGYACWTYVSREVCCVWVWVGCTVCIGLA